MAKKKKNIPVRKKKVTPSVKNEGWTIKRIFLPLGIAMLTLLVSSQVVYTQGFTSDVLGDEDNAQEAQQKEEEKRQEEQKKEAEKQQEETQKQAEQEKSGASKNTQQKETEVETKDGLKVKTKVEDNGATKVEIESEKIHFKFEEENGEVKLRVENGEGIEIRTRDRTQERDELERELEDEDISISSDDGHMEIEHNAVRTRTNFPLSMDPVTHELVVTTPQGEKTLAIMPDVALNNLFSRGVLTEVTSGSEEIPTDASPSAVFTRSLELKVVNGNLVYEVEGKKKEKFFGVIPVTLPRTVTVSALSGEVLSQTESVLMTILGFFSF